MKESVHSTHVLIKTNASTYGMMVKEWKYVNLMVLVIIFPLHYLPTRKHNRFYKFDQRIIRIASSLLLCLLVSSHVWYTRRQWGNMIKPNMLKLQVINAGSCPPICHLDIWDTQNKWKLPHDIKESVFIVKEVMSN